MKFKDVIVNMGLLTEVGSLVQNSTERSLLYDLWVILKGDQTETIYTENLRVIMQVIVRLIDPRRV